MIEKKYKVRRSSTKDETAEVTIPIGWRRYHKIQFGDEVTVFADGIIMILPPNISEEAEEKARAFLEGKGKNEKRRVY
jgi:bifunctional DNA-binding transcriptional regulator/antitoxin component of YhaV-PrlF toxin-antitoxin module